MYWSQWYRVRGYVQSSLWIVPFISLLVYALVIRLVYAIEGWTVWRPLLSYWGWRPLGTQSVLETIVTMMLTFIVFTFGSLLVAIQIAGGQLTPRIMAATLLRDNAIRFAVGLFTFTLLFSIGALARLETTVPLSSRSLRDSWSFLPCRLSFSDRLRRTASHSCPHSCARRRRRPRGHRERLRRPVYRHRLLRWSASEASDAGPDRCASRQARDPAGSKSEHLGRTAQKANVIIELMPRVGDFVATGETLFHVYGNAVSIGDHQLRGAVAFGPERTMEQDSTLAFRIIVDIAIKALSKAINDPTTAVLALDQLQHLLSMVGQRHLYGEEILDKSGELRVVFHTPNWKDFVQVTFSEIRLYGAENFQIARRLRAVIEHLARTLPEHRRPALRAELDLLDRTIVKLHVLAEDIALARVPDTQGLGGSSPR